MEVGPGLEVELELKARFGCGLRTGVGGVGHVAVGLVLKMG